MTRARVRAVLRRLWPDDFPGHARGFYAILDGARDPRLHALVESSQLERACLYDGPLAPPLAEVAPQLVHLHAHAPLSRALVELGWGRAWGVFLHATADVETLRLHLRRFLRVRDEDGRGLLFRFYDPRVLRAYLPTCTAGELRGFFGPITRFCVESGDGEALVELGLEHGRLRTRALPI